ncbi:hypothetical protein [Cognatilysobacter lacus]|uniref:Uncharacterized protein n=1 Tax=Cognatilysobacter lacus TaxID=1643323 RepID=A0A5D8ZDP9_9GAMM|nr:hypothetical protein [Lysobacter lacus]TZF90774.1 hypothetical protein FW784_03990 [Lysobacter lacus]
MDLVASLVSVFSALFTRVVGDRKAARDGARRRLPWAANRKLAGRLKEIIDMASSKDRRPERTVAHLCETIPGLSLASIESFMFGAAEPTLEQVRGICEALGASFRYLWFGDGHPFAADDEYPPPTQEYLGIFRDHDARSIVFVRGDRVPHPAYVVVQYNEFRYRVLPSYWHVSSINGNGGANALVELASLSENIYRTRTYKARGIDVPLSVAEDVYHGCTHASALWAAGWKASHWWDDLADVDHARACAKEYATRYDEEFFAAQKLIKWARSV